MSSYNKLIPVLTAIICFFILPLRASAEAPAISTAHVKPGLIIKLSSDATIMDVTNNVQRVTARYENLLAPQLRNNPSVKNKTTGIGEVYECELDPGITATFRVNGEHVASVTAQDKFKTGHTLGWIFVEGHHRLFMYSQALEGKADGPYVEYYRNGAVRCIFWFKDGLLVKGKIWDVKGELKESKEFSPPIDILKESKRATTGRHK